MSEEINMFELPSWFRKAIIGLVIFIFLQITAVISIIHHRNNHYTYKIEEVSDDGKIFNTYYTHKYNIEGGGKRVAGSTITFKPLDSNNKIGFSGKWRITEVTNE